MEDQVPFKVYAFWKECEKPEVRRFGIEKSVVTSYHYLNAKIQDIFPRLKGKVYSVSWKDEDGDDVVISSDEEVMTALQVLGGDIIKLFIYCNGDETKDDDVDIMITATTENHPETSGVNALHYGVMCDACDAPVVGFRYKCTSCDDYDLCSRCEAAGRHPEHCMVRVPAPTMPRTIIKAAIKRSRQFLKTVAGTVGEDCPYKRNRRDRSGGRHRGEGHGHYHSDEHPRDRHHRRPRSSWLETFATYMNEFANLAGDVDIDTGNVNPDTKPQERSSQVKQENAPNGQEKATKEATQTGAGASNAATQRPPRSITFNEVLEGFKNGPYMAQPPQRATAPRCITFNELLEGFKNGPFMPQPPHSAAAPAANNTEKGHGDRKATEGAKVTVNTETLDEQEKATREDIQRGAGVSNTATQRPPRTCITFNELLEGFKNGPFMPQPPQRATAPAANNTEMGQGDRKATEGAKVTIKTETLEEQERDSTPEKADDWTMINKDKDLMDTSASAPQEPAAPIGFNLPEEFQERVKISEGSIYPPLHAATAVLNTKEAEGVNAAQQPEYVQATGTTASAPASQQKPATAPPQPQPQPRQRHPKPHIDAAIQHMLAMGFTNEGGWLTQLLESKDGNIAAVLDLLTPVNIKQ